MKVVKDEKTIVLVFDNSDIEKIESWVTSHKNSPEYSKLSSDPYVAKRDILLNNEEENYVIIFDQIFYINGDYKDTLILKATVVDGVHEEELFKDTFDLEKGIGGLHNTISYRLRRAMFLTCVDGSEHYRTKIKRNIKVKFDSSK